MNDQQNLQEPNNQTDSTVYARPIVGNAPKKSRAKTVAVTLLILLLIAGLAALGYLYYQKNNELQSVKSDQASASSAAAQKQTESEKVAAAQPASDTVTYKATVGKFTLTLPNKYVVIKEIDGGYEGGPATWLTIGKTTDAAGVVDGGNDFSKIKIQAFPKANSGENVKLDEYVKMILGDIAEEKKALATRTIDGSTVKVYETGGFSTNEHHFFEKKDVFYHIEINSPDKESAQTVDYIYKGFKYNQ